MQAILAKDIMEDWEYKLKPEISFSKALTFLVQSGINYAPVVNELNQYLGTVVITPKIASETKSFQPIKDIMFTDNLVISPHISIVDIKKDGFTVPILPVVENKILKGVITQDNFTTHLLLEVKNQCKYNVEQMQSEINFYKNNYQNLKGIMNHSYDGFAITNTEGVTILVNKAWDRMTGLRREDIIGKPLEELVKKGFFSDSVSMKVIKSKKPTTIIQKMKSGKQAMMTGSPVFDENGKLYQVIINIRDVTELFQLKENLEQKEKLAERYLTEISQLRLKQTTEENIVAKSKTMCDLLDLAARIARFESTVLLTGESGVGKGVVAKFIHQRAQGGVFQPFIIVNCGAIPQDLLESELFGYVGGAFTGANRTGKIGMLELAEGGTLFLDEIAELPLKLQVKLLHVLQEKEMIRVGGTTTIKLNIRIITATNNDLVRLIQDGKFREDLFYRLNVVPLSIPPLRSRKEDILPLSAYYLNLYNRKYSLNKSLSGELLNIMLDYHWPGNIRELANLIERMIVTSNNDVLTPRCFPQNTNITFSEYGIHKNIGTAKELPTLKEANEQLEIELINKALQTGKTQVKAAEILGISLSTFIRKMKRFNIPQLFQN